MADTLDIFGKRYNNVTGIIATDSGGNELTYTRGGGQPTLQTKTATYTPTESQQTAAITADTGYDGLSEVDITVNAVSSTYVGTGITRRSSSDLTASGATVTVPSGYYTSQASKAVASMTLPSATSAIETGIHKADVFPSTSATTYLNIPVGYNSTAQHYKLRALMLDGKTITNNGTYYAVDDDLDGFSSVTVNVSGGSSNFTLLGSQSVGTVSTTSTTATDTGVSITVKGVYAYDLLVCECSVNTKTNGRHAATTRLCWLTASSAIGTKDAGTFATATWNCKLSSTGVATTRSNTTTYGVYANGITLSAGSTGDNGQAVITIYRRYNNTQTGTINGSYTMRVYGVKIYDLIGG